MAKKRRKKKSNALVMPIIIGVSLLIGLTCIGSIGSVGFAVYRKLGRLEWQTFTSPDGGYSVELPGKPIYQSHHEPTPLGVVTAHGQIVVKPFASLEAGVIHADLPFPAGQQFDVEGALDGGCDGMLQKSGATQEQRKTIKLGVHPGREMTAMLKGKPMRVRMYIVGKRMYQVLVVGSAAREGQAASDRVMASFALAGKTGP